MKKFYDELNEATALANSGGNPTYPDTGNISTDDDMPTGTTTFGEKMEKHVEPNRLTGQTVVWKPSTDDWNWDEFDNIQGMGSVQSYHQSLQGLNDLLNKRQWRYTDNRSPQDGTPDHIVKQEKEMDTDDRDHNLADDPGRIVKSKAKHSDILNKIHVYISENTEQDEDLLFEAVISTHDKKALIQAVTKGKKGKIKLTDMGQTVNITPEDDIIVLQYDKNDDITLALVDVADRLGKEFTRSRKGKQENFEIYD